MQGVSQIVRRGRVVVLAGLVSLVFAGGADAGSVPEVKVKAYGTALAPASISFEFTPTAQQLEAWYCWGDEDMGETFLDWPNNERIGTVAASVGSGNFTLPPSSVGAKAGRLFLVSAGGNYECSYIRSDSLQGIDTGVPANTNTAVWADIKFLDLDQTRPHVMGNNVKGGFRFYVYVNSSGTLSWTAVDTEGTTDGNNADTGILAETKRVQITHDCAKQVFKIEQDGAVLKSMKFSENDAWARLPFTDMSSTSPIGLLGSLDANGAWSRTAIAELYGAKIWTGGVGGTLKRDFRPWVNGGVAVMKDLVSNTYFSNAWTANGTQFVPGGRKTAPTVLFASASVDLANLTCDDVFADAAFWLRGMAEDKNGNGIVDDNEFKDVLGHTVNSKVYGATGRRMVYSNELVRLPGRGVERMMRTIYLPQTVTITNSAKGLGYIEPTTVNIEGATDGFDNHWTLLLRVRPDNNAPTHDTYQFIACVGSGTDRGIEIGFNGKDTGTNAKRGLVFVIAKKVVSPTAGGWTMLSGNTSFTNSYLGGWVDIALVADGQKLTALMIQEGDKLAYDDKLSVVQLGYRYVDSPGMLSFGNRNLYLGAEGVSSSKEVYPNGTRNQCKAFRGSFQQVAMWKRALSTAELFQAVGWPRTDLMRVGVANGTSDELEGNVPAAGLDADAEAWPLKNGLAAGESVTVRFPLVADYDTSIARILRWKALPDSPAAMLKATVNGTPLLPESVKPGKWAQWFVAANCLKDGTNTVTITRTDSGTGRLVPDVIALGGGWQLGKKDNAYPEFGSDNCAYQDYYIADGNLRDIRRVLHGETSKPTHSYNRFHFNVPEELTEGYRWKLRLALMSGSGSQPLEIKLNDKTILDESVAKGSDITLKLQAEDLQKGENVIHFRNKAKNTGTTYMGLDLLSLEPKPIYGFLIQIK